MSARRGTGSKLKTGILLLMIPVGFLLVMNLFWLRYSTTRVLIAGRGLPDVRIYVNDEVIELGDLRRGESRFMFLPRDGDAVYSVSFEERDYRRTACAVDVNETNNHVEVSLYPDRDGICTVTEPLFSELMVTKFF